MQTTEQQRASAQRQRATTRRNRQLAVRRAKARPRASVNAPKPVAPAAPAAVPAPAVPAPSALTGVDPLTLQPGDSGATIAKVGQAQYGADTGLAGADAAEKRLRLDAGFSEVAPGTAGAVQDPASGRWFKVDVTNNPYSQAARIKQEWDARKRATRITDASGGFLYDGVSASNDLANAKGELGSYNDLARSFIDGLGQINADRLAAFTGASDDATGARLDEAGDEAATIEPGQGDPDHDGKPGKAKPKRKKPRRKKRRK